MPFRRFRTYLPFVPSRELVGSFIASFGDLKMRLALSILYATGLRLDELCHLQCRDIYLKAGKVHVSDSKNRRDHFVPLPASLEPLVLSYWRSFLLDMRPRLWLFTQSEVHTVTTTGFLWTSRPAYLGRITSKSIEGFLSEMRA